MRKTIKATLLVMAMSLTFAAGPVIAAEGIKLPARNWSFTGMFGTFDRGSQQRGLQVYLEVCASCHSLRLLAYRNLAGIGFSEDQIKAIAAEAEVTGGLSPRIAPMAEIRDMGGLLQRAGFALPVADAFALTVTYASALHLMRDLRAMGEAALIPLRMFRIRVASVTIAASVIIGMAMFGGIMILPLYMQIVHGASPTKAGILMLPMVAGMMAASISSGRVISRTGHVRLFPIVGSAVIVLGLFLLSFTTADTPLPLVSCSMFVLGLGLGSCMQPLLLTVQSAVPPSEIGVATASATFFRQMGGTLGVAIFLSILFSTVGPNISTALDEASATPEFQQGVAQVGGLDESVVEGIQDDSSVLETLPDAVAHPFRVGFAESMDLVFLSAAGVGVLAFLILLLLPPVELRATSASAARASDTAAAAATPSPTSTPAAPRE